MADYISVSRYRFLNPGLCIYKELMSAVSCIQDFFIPRLNLSCMKLQLSSYAQPYLANVKIMLMGLSRRKCPVFQQSKVRILVIIWIIIEI